MITFKCFDMVKRLTCNKRVKLFAVEAIENRHNTILHEGTEGKIFKFMEYNFSLSINKYQNNFHFSLKKSLIEIKLTQIECF